MSCSVPLVESRTNDTFTTEPLHSSHQVCTGFIQPSLSKIQRLLKDFPPFFKDLKFMDSTDLSVKVLLQKC